MSKRLVPSAGSMLTMPRSRVCRKLRLISGVKRTRKSTGRKVVSPRNRSKEKRIFCVSKACSPRPKKFAAVGTLGVHAAGKVEAAAVRGGEACAGEVEKPSLPEDGIVAFEPIAIERIVPMLLT